MGMLETPALKTHNSTTPCDSGFQSPFFSQTPKHYLSPKNTSLSLVAEKMEGSKIDSSFFYNE